MAQTGAVLGGQRFSRAIQGCGIAVR